MPVRSNYGIELRQGNNPAGSVRQTSESLNPTLRKEEKNRYLAMGEAAYTQWAFNQAVQYIREHPGITITRIAQRIYVSWCTDIFDWWSWRPDKSEKWWNRGRYFIVLKMTTIVSALVPLAFVLFGLVSSRLRGLPYKFLFISLFLFLSLPYYFTSANDYYSQAVRPWLAMLAVVVLLGGCKTAGPHTAGIRGIAGPRNWIKERLIASDHSVTSSKHKKLTSQRMNLKREKKTTQLAPHLPIE